jgi:hypothetical protein
MLSSPVVEWTVAAAGRALACWYGDAEPLVALLAGRYQPLTNLGSSHLPTKAFVKNSNRSNRDYNNDYNNDNNNNDNT